MPLPDYPSIVRLALGEPVPDPGFTATEVRILDAALELIAEYGERLTIDDIAARAKVARKTIFRRFGSKDELLARVYERELRHGAGVIAKAAVRCADLAEAVVAAYIAMADLVEDHPVIQRLARAEPETLVRLWREGSPSGFEVVKVVLASAARRGRRTVARRDLDIVCDVLARQILVRELLPPGGQRARPLGTREVDIVRAIVAAVLDRHPAAHVP